MATVFLLTVKKIENEQVVTFSNQWPASAISSILSALHICKMFYTSVMYNTWRTRTKASVNLYVSTFVRLREALISAGYRGRSVMVRP